MRAACLPTSIHVAENDYQAFQPPQQLQRPGNDQVLQTIRKRRPGAPATLQEDWKFLRLRFRPVRGARDRNGRQRAHERLSAVQQDHQI